MFDQPGKKIKNYAIVMFMLTAALVGVGFVLALMATMQEGEGFLAALFWGALVCAVFLLATYLVLLLLYAVGDIAEETARQTELFEQNNKLLCQLLEGTAGASNATAPAAEPDPVAEPETATTPEPTPAPVILSASSPRSHTTVRCPKCGTPQGDAREKCYNCGTPLKSK